MVAKERGDKMNIYGELGAINILEPIKNKYKIKFDEAGNPKVYLEVSLAVDTPWISTFKHIDRKCNLWQTYFNNYGIIPSGCLKCYKVVMTLDKITDLFKVFTYQRESEIGCKCGIERRRYVGKVGKYGAYWYVPLGGGIEKGREIYNQIRSDFPDFPLILKRGCTEFEMMYSPSSKWDEIAKERDFAQTEEMLDTLFVVDPASIKAETNTPKLLEMDVVRRWIEYAFEHGDESYLALTGGQKFKIDLETYHEEGNNADSRSTKATGIGNSGLGRTSDEDSGIKAERNSSIIQGLPGD